MVVGRNAFAVPISEAKASAPAPSLSVNEAGTCGACKPAPPTPEIAFPAASVTTSALCKDC